MVNSTSKVILSKYIAKCSTLVTKCVNLSRVQRPNDAIQKGEKDVKLLCSFLISHIEREIYQT